MNQSHLLVIPMFNERNTIRSVINEVDRFVSIDKLIIDDGSTDNSGDIIKALDRTDIRVIRHSCNEGYGKSITDGFQYANIKGYRNVITMDCDFQHEPKHIKTFIQAEGSADIVSGSRYLEESNDLALTAPGDRKMINMRITQRINDITGFNITDAFCGYKAYRMEAVNRLSLTEKGYGLPLQVWIQAWFKGLSVSEVPVSRIYLHPDRSFGPELDDPERRLRYYNTIIDKEMTHAS